jgi:hypothetical protein
MDASRLQMEINRLRAKVQSAKMKEERELRTCNTRQDKNRIRSAPLPGAATSAKTKKSTRTKKSTSATNDSSMLYLDQSSRSQSVMIRVPCDIDE